MKLISSRCKSIIAVPVVALMLTACSTDFLSGDTVDYQSATQRPKLEIPPDLTRLEDNTSYRVPGATVDYADYTQGTAQTSRTGLTNSVGDVTLKRDGDKRWLVVERSSDEIWPTLEAFWQDLGFVLEIDEPNLGLLETDWAENRAKIPQDFIRRAIGAVFDSVYSTGERDKFRTRVELIPGGVEIYITHRGVEEVYNDKNEVTTVWQPRPSDPDLEAEMLRRLMMRLGVNEEKATAAADKADAMPARSAIRTWEGAPALELNETFDDAWRWVGISLDRISFTVIDRDRQMGIYRVRYIDPAADSVESKPGLLSGLFGGRKAAARAVEYQIKLTRVGETTMVQILNQSGGAVDPQLANKILNALAKDLS